MMMRGLGVGSRHSPNCCLRGGGYPSSSPQCQCQGKIVRGERGFRIRVFGCGGAGGGDLFWGFLRSFMLLSFECGKIGRGKACGLVVEKKLKRGGLSGGKNPIKWR